MRKVCSCWASLKECDIICGSRSADSAAGFQNPLSDNSQQALNMPQACQAFDVKLTLLRIDCCMYHLVAVKTHLFGQLLTVVFNLNI